MSGKDADNMHKITELPAWERLFKRIVWKQIGEIEGKRILDFGSGEGITANYFAEKNEVIAIEPSQEMLTNAWKDYQYTQIRAMLKLYQHLLIKLLILSFVTMYSSMLITRKR